MKKKSFKEDVKKDFNILKQRINEEKTDLLKLEQYRNLDKLINFLILGEDHRFRKHTGFDIIAIFRAIRNRIIYKKREGASTIEQQLIRVLTNQFEKNYRRKLKEIILATKLKNILTKKQIALLYLKLAYYGTNKQGLTQILDSFSLNIYDDLSDDTCAGIIARLKYPEPKANNSTKIRQIENRKKHIINLFNRYGKYY